MKVYPFIIRNFFQSAVTLVTGGASGLGFACVQRFIKQGSRVVLVDLPDSKGGQIAEGLGQDCLFAPADVRSDEDVENVMQMTKNKYGQLNYVINCAGVGLARKTYNITKRLSHELAPFNRLLEINTGGTFNVTRLAVPLMFENEPKEDGERGVVINTSSVAAYEGQVGQVAYAASKGAIAAMTLPMARDFCSMGIRVNCIAPGLFDTELLASLPPKVKDFLASTVPFPQRLGQPDEFAMLCQSIIENPMMNGEVIRLDGALRMQA